MPDPESDSTLPGSSVSLQSEDQDHLNEPKGRVRRLARGAALELAYLLFLLLLLEGTLRFGGLLFQLTRGSASAEEGAGEADLRILAIGESTTFGLGVSPQEAYPQRLESQIREKAGLEAVVYNVGVPGQTSVSILRTIDQQMWKYRPDLVLCLFGINDANEALNDLSARRLFGFQAPDWVSRLRTYRLACLIRDFALYAPKMEEHGAWVFFDPDQRRENSDWVMNFDYLPELEANYRDILAIVRSYGASPVLLSYLLTPRELLACLEQIASRERAPLLDLNLPKEELEGLLSADRFHPNAVGHERMARLILEGLPGEILEAARSN